MTVKPLQNKHVDEHEHEHEKDQWKEHEDESEEDDLGTSWMPSSY